MIGDDSELNDRSDESRTATVTCGIHVYRDWTGDSELPEKFRFPF
jgi:hypothetical protein